jgi:hypothetical protein
MCGETCQGAYDSALVPLIKERICSHLDFWCRIGICTQNLHIWCKASFAPENKNPLMAKNAATLLMTWAGVLAPASVGSLVQTGWRDPGGGGFGGWKATWPANRR